MAVVIETTGEEIEVKPKDPRQGFTLPELYKHLGCDCIEVVSLADGRRMVVDENGISKRLAYNSKASALYREGRKTLASWKIVGTALVGDAREIT